MKQDNMLFIQIMIHWFAYSYRNLFRNKRRSLYTIVVIGLGLAAINVFGGFTKYIFSNLSESYIYTAANGHLTIYKGNPDLVSSIDTTNDSLISFEDIVAIKKIANDHGNIGMIFATIYLSGMISNGETSTIFIGLSAVPSELYQVQKNASGMLATLKYFDGERLSDDNKAGIGVSRKLANKLGISIDSSLVLMAPTITGQINSIDAQVVQFTDTTQELLDDKLVLIPLELARSLLMSDGATRLHITLNKNIDLEEFRRELASSLADLSKSFRVATWRELSPFYVKVENMFDVIFLFMFIIVSTIVVISVSNTVSMSIFERFREIATMRALGADRFQIVGVFSLEGAILGIIGCFIGVILWGIVFIGMIIISPNWTPPQISRSIPLEIHFDLEYLIVSACILILLSLISSIFPAYRIASYNIVKALGHV